MIKTIVTSLLIVACNAGGYGGSGGSGSAGGASYGGGAANYGGNFLGSGGAGVPINAAVQSTHTVEIQTVDVPRTPIQPQIVEVDANVLPLTIHFKSASSHLNVFQTHQGSDGGEVQQTSSEDEPHHLIHEVTKPIIQEVREVITPFRRVIQEIKPVHEEIQTIVARGEPRNGGYGNSFNFGSNGALNSVGFASGASGGGINSVGLSSGGGINSVGYSTGSSSGGAINSGYSSGGAINSGYSSGGPKRIGESKSDGGVSILRGGSVSILSGEAAKSIAASASKSSGASPSLSKYLGDPSSKSSNQDYNSS